MGSVKVEKRQKKVDQIARQGFGETPDYVASIKNATLEKMTKLIKLVGMLLHARNFSFEVVNLLNVKE
jgi:hypothetical protein